MAEHTPRRRRNLPEEDAYILAFRACLKAAGAVGAAHDDLADLDGNCCRCPFCLEMEGASWVLSMILASAESYFRPPKKDGDDDGEGGSKVPSPSQN